MWHHYSNQLYLHTSKNYLCAISKKSVERVLEKKILKGFCKMSYIQIVFGYYFYDNVGSSNISEFCSVVLEKKIFKDLNMKQAASVVIALGAEYEQCY